MNTSTVFYGIISFRAGYNSAAVQFLSFSAFFSTSFSKSSSLSVGNRVPRVICFRFTLEIWIACNVSWNCNNTLPRSHVKNWRLSMTENSCVSRCFSNKMAVSLYVYRHVATARSEYKKKISRRILSPLAKINWTAALNEALLVRRNRRGCWLQFGDTNKFTMTFIQYNSSPKCFNYC